MKNINKTFGIIGGDLRNYYLSQSLKNKGFSVRICGFDNLAECNSLTETLNSDILVFPIIPFEKEKTVKTPYSNKCTDLTGFEKEIENKNKLLFTGKRECILREFPGVFPENVKSYSDTEEFSVKNAVPTAEGAIAEAMKHSQSTISSSKTLVCGYGRIGKVLSEMLRGLGAEVCISARKKSDLAWIELNGFDGTVTGDFKDLSQFSLIFNTVPAMIFNKSVLNQIKRDALIIDLASKPGGVDFEYAGKLGIKTVHALALPGKAAPKSAGEIIEGSILDILEEDNG